MSSRSRNQRRLAVESLDRRAIPGTVTTLALSTSLLSTISVSGIAPTSSVTSPAPTSTNLLPYSPRAVMPNGT